MNTSTLFYVTIMVIILTVLGIFANTGAFTIRSSHEDTNGNVYLYNPTTVRYTMLYTSEEVSIDGRPVIKSVHVDKSTIPHGVEPLILSN